MNRTLLAALLAATATTPAFAQSDLSAMSSLSAGFIHPLMGVDHIMVMIAVGLWGAMAGGRAVWALPVTFVIAMVAGFTFALGGMALPMVEPMILVSVIVLGLMVAFAVRLPLAGSVSLVALLAIFHGHSHGTEVGGASVLMFGLGFAGATAMLHSIGVVFASALTRFTTMSTSNPVLRAIGGLAALGGIFMAS